MGNMADGRLHRWMWGTPEGRMKFYAHPVRWTSIFWVYFVVFMWVTHWSRRAEAASLVADVVGATAGAAILYTWMKWRQRHISAR